MTPFDGWIAERFETLWPEEFAPEVVDPAVEVLVELAGGGPALELAVGTGRIALPLSRRGVAVHGIELSPAMAAHLDGSDVEVTIGDMATTTVAGEFTLVYLLCNTITNLATQDAQVACFANAAAHIAPGGRFVIENSIPDLQRLPPDETTRVFKASADHVGIEEYDVARQIAVSHHWWTIDGELKAFSSTHRYLWPAELDLMARMAGLVPCHRWANWHREPFTGASRKHVSVWEKPASPLTVAGDGAR